MRVLAAMALMAAGCVCRFRDRHADAGRHHHGDSDSDSDGDTDTGSGTGTGTETESRSDTASDTSSGTGTPTDTGIADGGADAGLDAGECNGRIGDPVPHEDSRHCVPDGGPDAGGCAYASWDNNPPASGVHCPLAERDCGEHLDVVDRCNWVHNLEHGWIVLLYNCPKACDADLATLRRVIEEGPVQRTGGTKILLTEDPLLDSRFAAVAWDWVWEGDALDLETLRCFVTWHYGGGPEGSGMPDGGLSLDAGPDGGPSCP
jgi:hypothetical protein